MAADDAIRILVVGASRQRVQNVISLIEPLPSSAVEFIPCVAQFDSYETNDSTTTVRYLVNLKAFERGSNEHRSLLPLFDAASVEDSPPPIAGAAIIGVGMEGEADANLVHTFLQTMMRFPEGIQIPVAAIQPNAEYATMAEEMQAYRNLTAEEKATVSESGLMGPGKMAAFVSKFSLEIIQDPCTMDVSNGLLGRQKSHDSTPQETAPTTKTNNAETTLMIDSEKTMYLCRKCRTVLFGIDSLNEHAPAKHSFSYRKQASSNTNTITCQSMFLVESLPWMGDTNANEGKFGCPRCHSKLGGWNWSGAQCSCGTWVVPAIQIPTSRMDAYEPRNTILPPGTILSSLLLRNVTTSTD